MQGLGTAVGSSPTASSGDRHYYFIFYMFEKLDQIEEMKSNLSFWFPLLQQIGMRVPETYIIHRNGAELESLLDGIKPKNINFFLSDLQKAIDKVGYPCFLRTGATSNKHDWVNSCFVTKTSTLINHVANLVEASFMANIAGLPFNYDYWVVRKMIETKPITTYFNKMPIAREIRAFIKDGKTQCVHPYWPEEALSKVEKKLIVELQVIPEEGDEIYLMIDYIAKHFSGYWSVDFLQDVDGKWWCTDMAVGQRSYHFPDCTKNK